MATLFDSYNNARAPLPTILLHFWATHTQAYTHLQVRPVWLEDYVGYHDKLAVAVVDSKETDNAHANWKLIHV